MTLVEKIKNKVKESFSKAKSAHFKGIKIVLSIFIICALCLAAAPYLFNNSALQFQIEQKLSAALKANFEIGGKVDIVFVPTPAIIAGDVVLQNYNHDGKNYNLAAKKITIKLSPIAALMQKFVVKKIIFSQAFLQSYDSENRPKDFQGEALEIGAKKTVEKKANGVVSSKIFIDLLGIDKLNIGNFDLINLPKIVVEQSSWATYDKFNNKREVNNINVKASFLKHKITAEGFFSSQEIVNNFNLSAKFNQKFVDDNFDDDNSFLEINSSYGNFKINGVFLGENLGLLKSEFRGKIEAEIFDLKSFYKSCIAREGFIYNKINQAVKPIKIKAFLLSSNSQININDIAVNSEIINGEGDVAIDLSTSLPLIDIKMGLENIDLDTIWLSDKEVAGAVENSDARPDLSAAESVDNSDSLAKVAIKKEESDLTINLAKDIRDFDLAAEIAVKSIKYLNEEVKNISLYATISKQGEILILPLTLEVPGGGLFRMSGVLENRAEPKFIGSLDIKGPHLSSILKWLRLESQNLIYDNLKNYTLYADIFLIPNSAIFNNIYLNINDGKTELLGEARMNYNAKNSSILSNFRINNLVVEDYFLTSGQNIYLSPGSLLKKFLWLNNLTSNNDVSLAFDKLAYKNSIFNNQSIKMRFGQGYLEVSELKLNSADLNLSASLSVDIRGSDPKFSVAIKSTNFNYKSLENFSADGDKNGAATAQNNKITILDQFYALPSLEGFGGDIMISLDKANFDDFLAENVKINGILKDGIVNFKDFSADIYGGNLSFSGVMGIKFDKAISGNVVLSEVSLNPVLSDLMGIKNINAAANISASIENSSGSKNDFFKNLNSSIKFSLAGVTVENYGLSDLIKKMFNARNYANELRDPEKILFNSESSTFIKEATGTVEIEKGRDSLFRADIATTAANGIVSGKVDLTRRSIDGSTNIIFLTGNLKKQIPLNIATNFRGDFSDIRQNTNLDQVKQYLGLPYEAKNTSSTISAVTADDAIPNLKLNN